MVTSDMTEAELDLQEMELDEADQEVSHDSLRIQTDYLNSLRAAKLSVLETDEFVMLYQMS